MLRQSRKQSLTKGLDLLEILSVALQPQNWLVRESVGTPSLAKLSVAKPWGEEDRKSWIGAAGTSHSRSSNLERKKRNGKLLFLRVFKSIPT